MRQVAATLRHKLPRHAAGKGKGEGETRPPTGLVKLCSITPLCCGLLLTDVIRVLELDKQLYSNDVSRAALSGVLSFLVVWFRDLLFLCTCEGGHAFPFFAKHVYSCPCQQGFW